MKLKFIRIKTKIVHIGRQRMVSFDVNEVQQRKLTKIVSDKNKTHMGVAF